MFDILVYLFENFYQNEAWPEQATLAKKLTDAGFENEDITDALDWLGTLAKLQADAFPDGFDLGDGFRAFTAQEFDKLSAESRGFICFLESARVLTPSLRELIIDRAMAIEDDTVELQKLKVIALMVLWTRRGNVDTLVLEELLPEGGPRHIH